MRNEREMMELILNVARRDGRIRAVGMNGSRTNPNAPKDWLQDYDIVYIVTDVRAFVEDEGWIDAFGERIILQTPDDMGPSPSERGDAYAYLMLFTDGNRIDLTLWPAARQDEWNGGDKLSVVLLDKDGALPHLPPPTDEDYRVKRPSAREYADCCNEFWWVSTYVAKGLWRRELLYAYDHLNFVVRPMLVRMLEWRAGVDAAFAVSVGKNGKYLEKYVSAEHWRGLSSTFPDGTYESGWQALFASAELFRRVATEVGVRLGYDYPHEDDRRVTEYLERVRALGPEATGLFGGDGEG